MHPGVLPLLLVSTLSVEIPIYVGADVPPLALERALAEADGLFAAGAIRFEWRLSPSDPSTSPPALVVILRRPETVVVSGCSRNLHDHRLGHTHLEARRVTLWTEQVARAVEGGWDRKEPPRVDESALGTALGRVLAHELGHLFLRLNGHRENGLMKAAFSHRSLVGKSDRAFRLSDEDLDRVRAALTRLKNNGARRAPSSPSAAMSRSAGRAKRVPERQGRGWGPGPLMEERGEARSRSLQLSRSATREATSRGGGAPRH